MKPINCPLCSSKAKYVYHTLEFFTKIKLVSVGCSKCDKIAPTFNVKTKELANELWKAAVVFNVKKFNL